MIDMKTGAALGGVVLICALGSAAFMAVGAYAAFNLSLRLPGSKVVVGDGPSRGALERKRV